MLTPGPIEQKFPILVFDSTVIQYLLALRYVKFPISTFLPNTTLLDILQLFPILISLSTLMVCILEPFFYSYF